MGCASSSESDPPGHSQETANVRRNSVKDHATTYSRPATEAANVMFRSSMSGSMSSSDVPPIFSPSSLDRSMLSVREFSIVKDLLRRWSSSPLPPSVLRAAEARISPVSSRNTAIKSATDGDGPLEALDLLYEIRKHRAVEIKYFSSLFFFTSLDVVTMSGILAHGHTSRPCTHAADPSGDGLANVAKCLEVLLAPAIDVVVNGYSQRAMQADLARAPRAPVSATAVINEIKGRLFGPAGVLEDPEAVAAPTPRSARAESSRSRLTNYDKFQQAVALGLRTLYLASGGTSSLAGNLGRTGLPRIDSLDRLFLALRNYAIGADGELAVESDLGTSVLTEFSLVLAWLGVIPRPPSTPANEPLRAEEKAHAVRASLFGQSPCVLLSPSARRALMFLEFRVFRKAHGSSAEQPPAVVLPRIPRRCATLAMALRGLMRVGVMPRSMAAFSQASVDPTSQCLASRPMIFETNERKLELMTSPLSPTLHATPGMGPATPQLSPNTSASPPRPAGHFIAMASRLLVSRAGDSADLSKAFNLLRVTRSLIGASLHLGCPKIEEWDSMIECGDIVEMAGAAYHVVEVNHVSTEDLDPTTTTPSAGILALVTVDDAEKIDLIVHLQPLGLDDDNDSLSDADGPLTTPAQGSSAVVSYPVWLRKRVSPLFVPGRNEYRFNDSLLQLTPEGVALAEASVTSHLGLQESKLKASQSLQQLSQSASHIDAFVDRRQRKQLFDTLQQFYFIGLVIALAIARDTPLSVKLPVLLFRVLKSYRPSGAPARGNDGADGGPRPFHEDADPTSSSFTANAEQYEDDCPQSTFSCHFVATVEDLREKGADAAVERVELVRRMSYIDFEAILEREHLPLDMTKEAYIRDHIVAPNVLSPSLRVYIDATFIAIADSGINRSVAWQLSSPAELRDLVCS